jgi:hypothetical protein
MKAIIAALLVAGALVCVGCAKKSAEGQSCAKTGDCAGDMVCKGQTCCQPKCDERECGDDGCGGVCGDCDEGEACSRGQCKDGYWTDPNSGLTWELIPNGMQMPVADALHYCATLSSGWRLPTRDELFTLIPSSMSPPEGRCYWWLVNRDMTGRCGKYWSSTPPPPDRGPKVGPNLLVDFEGGITVEGYISSAGGGWHSVRCVR